MTQFSKKEKIDDSIVLKLWYQGAGDLYRRNHGLWGQGDLLWARLHDNPKERLTYYIIGCVGDFGIVILLLYFLYFMIYYPNVNYGIKLLIMAITGILSLIFLFFGLWIFISAKKLHNAVKSKTDIDLVDSFRMNSLRKAIYRLIKEGKIIKEYDMWKINKIWAKTTKSNIMQFTKKEKIGYGILGIMILLTGLYYLIFGAPTDALGGAATFGSIGDRILGLFVATLGAWFCRAVIKSPTIFSDDNSNK